MPVIQNKKQTVLSISYQQLEAPKLLAMEDFLMDHYGYNRSQLHKQLVRDKYPGSEDGLVRSDRSDGDSKDVLEQKLRYLEQRLLDTEECSVRTHQVDLLVNEIDAVRASLLKIEMREYYDQISTITE